MLTMLKNIIKEQQAYLEAADLILEDEELDDAIVLGGNDMEEDDESDTDPTGEPMPTGNDDLPEPVGAQTGEPAGIDDSDLLNVTIDLGTNTQTDTLPVPPSGAGDSIEGDDSHYASSGFSSSDSVLDAPVDGGDDLDAPIEPEPKSTIDEPLDDVEDEEGVPASKPEEPEKNTLDDEIDSEDDGDDDNDSEEKTESYSFLNIPISEPMMESTEPIKEENDDTMDDEIPDFDDNTSPSNSTPNVNEFTFLGGNITDYTPENVEPSSYTNDLDVPISEAITVGGDTGGDQPADGTDAGDAPDVADDEQPEDNAVTTAVKDKVEELDDADSFDTGDTGEGDGTVKDELLKKLGTFTKSLEDVKKTIMDNITN